MDGSHNDMLQNDSEEAGNGSSSVRKTEALTVKMHTLQTMEVHTVTLIGKGKWNPTHFVH
jgi:hypothetical protein